MVIYSILELAIEGGHRAPEIDQITSKLIQASGDNSYEKIHKCIAHLE